MTVPRLLILGIDGEDLVETFQGGFELFRLNKSQTLGKQSVDISSREGWSFGVIEGSDSDYS